MRSLGCAGGIFCLLISSVACSEDVRIGNSNLKISPPTGFCELDKTNKADVESFDAMSNYSSAAGFSVIAIYPDCRELAESRKSHAFIPTKVAISRWLKNVDRPPSQFISEACDQIRKSGLSDEQKVRVSQYVTEFSKGNSSLRGALSLGVLDEVKGTVCYAAQMIKARVAGAGDVTLVSLSAITTVADQPIVLKLSANYRDASSIATGLASLKTIYSDFAAANGKTN